MKIPADQIVAAVVATSFAAGLNLYATVATLGLLAHLGVLGLPPALELLGSWWVIGASGALFTVEFFADKIPAFDLIWNALHTFIRVPVAALLAYRATATLSPWEQLLVTIAGGAIAFAAHGGKTAARTAVTASPEPFSNAALSLGGGWPRHLSDLVCHPASLLGCGNCDGARGDHRAAGAMGIALTAGSFPRSGRGGDGLRGTGV
jgi:hypothetical protein